MYLTRVPTNLLVNSSFTSRNIKSILLRIQGCTRYFSIPYFPDFLFLSLLYFPFLRLHFLTAHSFSPVQSSFKTRSSSRSRIGCLFAISSVNFLNMAPLESEILKALLAACSTSCKLLSTIMPRRNSLMTSDGSSSRRSRVRVTFATKRDILAPRRSLEKASKSLKIDKKYEFTF